MAQHGMPASNHGCIGKAQRLIACIYQLTMVPDTIHNALTIGESPDQAFRYTPYKRMVKVAFAPCRQRPRPLQERKVLNAVALGSEHAGYIVGKTLEVLAFGLVVTLHLGRFGLLWTTLGIILVDAYTGSLNLQFGYHLSDGNA